MASTPNPTGIDNRTDDAQPSWLAWSILITAVTAVIIAAAIIPAPADTAPTDLNTEQHLWHP